MNQRCLNYPLRWLLTLSLLMAGVARISPAEAQQLLSNGSFETPAGSAQGNNFFASIANWTVTNLSPAQSQPFNIVRPWAGYAGNPSSPPSGGGNQYLDINSASGTISQSFTVTSPGMVSLSGWFSVRDFQQALTGTQILLRDSGGTVVATAVTSFSASDPIGLWKQAQITYVPVQAGTYFYEALIPNYANFDIASVIFSPPLTVTKSSTVYRDPVNGTSNAKRIPGGIINYQLTITAPSDYSVSNNSIVVYDATPANMSLVVSGSDAISGVPASFSPGSTGLTYTFTSLSSVADGIDFSNDNGVTWGYTPVVGADGTDVAITHVRVRPSGVMAASSSFTINLRYRIR